MRKAMAYVCLCMLLAPAPVWTQAQPSSTSTQSSSRPAARSSAATEESGAQSASARLPVRRVVLFKNGVGYFEHVGRVRGSQDVTIDFTSGQLNDVLKSLTVLDLGGGRVTAVNYNSEAPFDRRLGSLPLAVDEDTTLARFLGTMRGAQVQATAAGVTVTGRLLSIERKTRISGGTTLEVDMLSLIGDNGEVRSVELSPAVSVRIVERDLNEDVRRYMDLLASLRRQDLRRMVVSAEGTGERNLFVAYISEVPVWKTTYRIVLPSKAGARPLLQGWAIVDNTVGEDWDTVELSLVAGAPQSFIQHLSQPYYAWRPSVGLPTAVQLTPQTHQGTLVSGYGSVTGTVTDSAGAVVPGATVVLRDESNRQVSRGVTNSTGRYELTGVPAGRYRIEVSLQGFKRHVAQNLAINPGQQSRWNAQLEVGEITNTVVVEASFDSVNTYSSVQRPSDRTLGSGAMLGSGSGAGFGGGVGGGTFRAGPGSGVGSGSATTRRGVEEFATSNLQLVPGVRASADPSAQGRDLGDLFEYKLTQPITIRKNQSALVPILQTEIAAEKVSLWSEAMGSARPLRAVWLTNSSALTLDGGSFNVIEGEVFAGEGLMEPIKPGEKRLLSYAADLAMRVDARQESERQRVTHVRMLRGVMVQSRQEVARKIYTVRNEDSSPRALLIEHPVRSDWKLAGETQPEETSLGYHRFRLQVEPKATATLTVTEVRPIESRININSVDEEQMRLFLAQRSINAEMEAALRDILVQKKRIGELESEVEARNEAMQKIFDDQQRVRENLKALRGSAEEKALIQRYTRQLDEQENTLARLRAELAALEKQQAEAQAALEKTIESLALEAKL